MQKRFATTLLLGVFISACATPYKLEPQFSCFSNPVLLDAHFDGGQLGQCRGSGDGAFELDMYPEDEPPINPSAWYAFRVNGSRGDRVHIRMRYENGYARYWPKISVDGETWYPAEDSQVVLAEDGTEMQLDLELEQAQLWVAGQEITPPSFYSDWIAELEAHPDLVTSLVGASAEGRPIYLAENDDHPEYILMIGRQHPPEVTGAIAMKAFINTVLSDTPLASQFRARFKLLIIPLVNPDGVAKGHWRHNVNGVDLNRDWGPFSQPETRAVRRRLDQVEASGMNIRLMLDFHSTSEDLFYTQLVTSDPVDFASLWLGASADRLPDFPFKHEANPVSEQANSKNYFFTTYGIPAITYESGDETSRDQLRSSAVIFAEEMMRVMLENPL